MIEEQQRHQYLEALGISSWLPRAELPGAAPTPDWVWDFSYPAPDIPFADTNTANADTATKPSVSADPAAARASLTRSFASGPKPEVKEALWREKKAPLKPTKPEEVSLPENDDAVAIEAATQTPARPQPRFKLALARFGRALVVDSLPPQSQNDFSPSHQALAGAIVRSVCNAEQPLQGSPFLLPWPMFASPTLPQGYDEALQTVQHKLDRLLADGGVDVVLLMGESAARMVLEREEELAELSGILFSVRADIKALATHSLTEAMQVPGIKPVIWQQLQPLLKHLQDG